ncbi:MULTISPECIES: succinylglutamate-semialdehyde dehydrogenase [unclassified Acinetobacter]|uniref:succinylglutamate-semialdehyde dehydrogenase n=1 Tax=unclassified Acinetobacter TaxID=196816 RepID=UPI0035B854BE
MLNLEKSTGQIFINGEWLNATGKGFEKTNPVTGELIWQGNESTPEQVNDACDTARQAFKLWVKTALDERIAIVKKFAELLTANKEQLASIISQETSKPIWETRTEIAAMIGKIDISIKAYHERTGTSETAMADGKASLRHRPHGVLAVFGPYNFPGHLPNGHIVPALIAGNTIVFKPSELTPWTAEATLQLWQQAGLPKGVINLVQGGRVTGEALAKSPKIDGLLFTGSATTGFILSEQLAAAPNKILALEMGGNNALILEDIEDIDATVNLAIQSAFISAGQRCTCARRILVKQGEQGDKFIARFVEAVSKLKVGKYDAEPQPFMGGVVSLGAAQNMLKAQDKLLGLGAKSLLTMTQADSNSSLLSPAILDVTGIDNIPDEEYFGPLTTIRRYADFDEAIELANNTQFGLSCGLVSPNRELFERLLIEGRAGIINWNKPLTGASSAAPFGGVGASGNHRPSAYYAADYCAYPVASLETDNLTLPSELSPGIQL